MSGIAIIQRYAGIASVSSLKLISPTVVIIRKPTKISAGAVAKSSIAQNIAARNLN